MHIKNNSALAAYIRKCLAIVPAVPLMGFGAAFLTLIKWGNDPLTNLDVGLSNYLPLSVGTIDMLLGLLIFIAAFAFKREWVNFGSFIFCLGTGPCIDLFSGLMHGTVDAAVAAYGTAAKFVFLIIGSICIILSLAYYIPIQLGYAQCDILAFTIAGLIGKSYGVGLSVAYVILFVASVLLGAPYGAGTIVSIFFYGKMVDLIMPHTKKFTYLIAGIHKGEDA